MRRRPIYLDCQPSASSKGKYKIRDHSDIKNNSVVGAEKIRTAVGGKEQEDLADAP
jgi:hypothetical protein